MANQSGIWNLGRGMRAAWVRNGSALFAILLVLVAWPLLSHVTNTSLAGKGMLDLGPRTQWIADPGASLSIAEVRQRPAGEWQGPDSHYPALGFQDEPVWFRAPLAAQDLPRGPLWLEFGFPVLTRVDAFLLDARGNLVAQWTTGTGIPVTARPISGTALVVPLEPRPREGDQFLVRVHTVSAMRVPLHVWNAETFLREQNAWHLGSGVEFGLLVGFLVMALFFGRALHERYFSWLAAMIGSMLVIALYRTGTLAAYLLPGAPVAHRTVYFAALASLTCCVAYSQRSSLRLAAHWHAADVVMRRVSWLTLLVGITGVLTQSATYNAVLQVQLCIVVCMVLVLSILAWRRGYPGGLHFAVLWVLVILTGVGRLAGGLFGLGHLPEYVDVLPEAGVVLGGLTMGDALSMRVLRAERERERARRSAGESLRRFERVFDNALEGLFVWIPDSSYLICNQALARFLGYESPEAFDRAVAEPANMLYEPQRFADIERRLRSDRAVREETIALRRADGSRMWAILSMRRAGFEGGQSGFEGAVVDVTALKDSQERLLSLANHDPLTGLANRRAYADFMDELKRGPDSHDQRHVLFYIDLSRFKLVNDTLGHEAGDRLLAQAAKLIQSQIGAGDLAARLGGDEFGVVLVDEDDAAAEQVGMRIIELISGLRFAWEGKSFSIGAAIGAISFRAGEMPTERLTSMADTACYLAKEQGSARLHWFHEAAEQASQYQRESGWIPRIQHALVHGGFVLFGQEIQPIAAPAGRPKFELLIRYRAEDGTITQPATFLRAAERYGLSTTIDEWAVQTAMTYLRNLAGRAQRPPVLSINLSAAAFSDDDFRENLLSMLDTNSDLCDCLSFELTETMALRDMVKTVSFVNAVRARGCTVALDDFGSGFASYASLISIPLDYLKIDGSFIRGMVDDPVKEALVRSFVDIGRSLNVRTIAEFVESSATHERLARLGVDYGQGFYYHAPQLMVDSVFTIAAQA